MAIAEIDPSTYDLDPDSPTNSDDVESVIVPETNIPLSPNSLQQLESQINPFLPCNDFGKQLYLDTVQLIFTLMQNNDLL